MDSKFVTPEVGFWNENGGINHGGHCSICEYEIRPLSAKEREYPFPNEEERQLLFPRDVDLAVMSEIEYWLNVDDNCIHNCIVRDKNKSETKCDFLVENGWRLLGTFRKLGKLAKLQLQSHCASAFYNINSRQLVIVHRGTNSKIGKLEEIFEVPANDLNGNTRFAEIAYVFTKAVAAKYGSAARSITVTGHSLGGWLAQSCAFRFKYPGLCSSIDENVAKSYLDCVKWKNNISVTTVDQGQIKQKWRHLHCVCFDSPGFQPALVSKIPNCKSLADDRLIIFRYLDSLDVTVYLAENGTIGNIVHDQIGSVFQMKGVKKHSSDIISDFFLNIYESPNEENENEILRTEVQQKVQSKAKRQLKKAKENLKELFIGEEITIHKNYNPSKFRTSIFDEQELEFCQFLSACEVQAFENGQEYFRKLPPNIQPENYKLKYDAQVIDLSPLTDGKEDILDARDRFIEQMKLESQNEAFFPAIADWHRQTSCEEYRTFLPKLHKSYFGPEFKASKEKLCILKVQAPKRYICVAHVYNLWISELEANPVPCFFLNTKRLDRLNAIQPGFSKQIAKLSQLKLIVIECLENYKLDLLWGFLCELLPNSDSRFDARKVILITSDTALSVLRTKQRNEQALGILDETREQTIDSKYLITNYDSLNAVYQNEIKKKEIHFCGSLKKVGDLLFDQNSQLIAEFADLDLSFALFPDKIASIGNPVPKLTNFEKASYIKRKLYKIICGIKTEEVTKSKEKVLISSPKKWCADIIRKLQLKEEQLFIWSKDNITQYNCQPFIFIEEINEESQTLDKLRSFVNKKCINGHWLKCDSQIWEESHKLIWFDSFGTPSMKYLDLQYPKKNPKDSGTFTARDLLNNTSSRLTIIADDPGKGKSITMKRLVSIVGVSCIPTWVIYFDLQHCKEAVSELKKGQISYDTLLNFLAKFEIQSCHNGTSLLLLEAFLKISGRVHIFFDGFDEIPHELQQKVQELIKSLLAKSKAKVFLASRVHMRYDLTKYFHRYCYAFQDFTDREKIKFLRKYWTSHITFADDPDFVTKNSNDRTAEVRHVVQVNVVKKYSEELIQEFKTKIGEAARELIGTPLYMYMLATIAMKEHFIPYYKLEVGISNNENPKFPNFSNRVSFYEKFIEEKFKIGLEEKWHLNPKGLEFVKEATKSRLKRVHQSCAFEFLFGLDTAQKFFDYKSVEAKLDYDALKEAEIVVKASDKSNSKATVASERALNSQDRLLFIHRTLAEYFAADFIVTEWTKNKQRFKDSKDFNYHVNEMKTFLDDQLFLKENTQFRLFLNELILQHESTPTPFRNINNPEKVLNYLKQLNAGTMKLEYDCFNRTILHFIFNKVMDKELKLKNYGTAFVNAGMLLDCKDIFDATPFAYLQPSREMQMAVSVVKSSSRVIVRRSYLNYGRVILGAILGALEIDSGENVQDAYDLSYFGIHQSVSDQSEENCDLERLYRLLRKSLPHKDFIEKWNQKLIDLDIAIRTNDYSNLNNLLHKGIFRDAAIEDCKKLLGFTLTLGDGSRIKIAYLLLQEMTNNPNQEFRKIVDSEFAQIVSRNSYNLYKSAVKLLKDEDYHAECMILGLLLQHNTLNDCSPLYNALIETEFITFKRALIIGYGLNTIYNGIFCLFKANSDKKEARIKILEICLHYIVEHKQIMKRVSAFHIRKILWCFRFFTEVNYFSSAGDFNNQILIKNMSPEDLLKKFKECYTRIVDKEGKAMVDARAERGIFKDIWENFKDKMETVEISRE